MVLRERIAKETTIKKITTILEHVVSQGLGKKAGSQSFLVAGKTGTAQISKVRPDKERADELPTLVCRILPEPTSHAIAASVCIQKLGLTGFGRRQSWRLVFHDIAEGIMAQSLKKLEATDDATRCRSCIPTSKRWQTTAS